MSSMDQVIQVRLAFDPEAAVWFVESSDVPGLNLEASSVEEMQRKLPGAIIDLLESTLAEGDFDLPVEIIAHASSRVRGRALAA